MEKKELTWLWLEDQIHTVADYKNLLFKNGYNTKLYETPNQLIEFLLQEKAQEGNNYQNKYGFILDTMLIQAKYIIIPREWSKKDEVEYYKTNADGYDAGLVFCENFILPYWKPLPPIVFLSITNSSSSEHSNRFNTIKTKWSEKNGCDTNNVKVAWLNKWDAESELLEILKKFGEK